MIQYLISRQQSISSDELNVNESIHMRSLRDHKSIPRKIKGSLYTLKHVQWLIGRYCRSLKYTEKSGKNSQKNILCNINLKHFPRRGSKSKMRKKGKVLLFSASHSETSTAACSLLPLKVLDWISLLDAWLPCEM